MDTRILFWAAALANMGLIVALAAHGVRLIRRGEVAAHRRAMLAACGLVGLFLLSYAVKRVWLGREALELWSRSSLVNLWVHETMVMGMLIAGGLAFLRGRRLARTRRVSGRAEDPPAESSALRAHRRAGWVAVVASALGFATACGILAGMLGRT